MHQEYKEVEIIEQGGHLVGNLVAFGAISGVHIVLFHKSSEVTVCGLSRDSIGHREHRVQRGATADDGDLCTPHQQTELSFHHSEKKKNMEENHSVPPHTHKGGKQRIQRGQNDRLGSRRLLDQPGHEVRRWW